MAAALQVGDASLVDLSHIVARPGATPPAQMEMSAGQEKVPESARGKNGFPSMRASAQDLGSLQTPGSDGTGYVLARISGHL